MPKVPLVKSSFNLPEQELDGLRAEAAERGITVTQVLREAIADHRYLREQRSQGKDVLIKDKNGDVDKLVWRD